jgi:hypothetical protein
MFFNRQMRVSDGSTILIQFEKTKFSYCATYDERLG